MPEFIAWEYRSDAVSDTRGPRSRRQQGMQCRHRGERGGGTCQKGGGPSDEPHGHFMRSRALLRRVLEPAVLMRLRDQELHGYDLAKDIGDWLPMAVAVDTTTLYRLLDQLETEGALDSRWEAGDGGGRRVYRLTGQGRGRLEAWRHSVERDRARMDRWLERFSEAPGIDDTPK